MPTYRLNLELPLYVHLTPAGAYRALTSPGGKQDVAAGFLQALLRMPETPPLSTDLLAFVSRLDDEQEKLGLLYRLQELGYLVGEEIRRKSPELNMEREVPLVLEQLSSTGKGLLADGQGLPIASVGFAHETIEELAGLAASFNGLAQRFRPLLHDNLHIEGGGWGVMDAAADGRLGFWPLQVGEQVLTIVVAGRPNFNVPGFLDLAWWLVRRYG
ncbi:MAG: hypothetical protein N2441_08110 [Rhodocyclaceae bacterium]|nr:hypothetical protein [Rhodocyclaceae bacterium]